jgi:hypothetical protein
VIKGTYNHPGNTKGIRCAKHALEGMVNIRIYKCLHPEGCTSAATVNYEGNKKPIRCSKHKEINMIDVVHAKCKTPGCKSNAHFNFANTKGSAFCKKHAPEQTVAKDSRICKFEGCIIHSTFGDPILKKRAYCKDHAPKNYIDLCSAYCIAGCGKQVYCHSNKGYCFACHNITFPDNKNPRQYKIRENAVVDFVKTFCPNIIADKIIEGGKSAKRPDILIEFEMYVIIIEIDEDQHRRYQKDSDADRLIVLKNDINKFIVMIRFNPDYYINSNNTPIKSCWSKINGIMQIVRQVDWNSRLERLKEVTQYYITTPQTNDCLIKLYYLGHDEANHDNTAINFANVMVDETINPYTGKKIDDIADNTEQIDDIVDPAIDINTIIAEQLINITASIAMQPINLADLENQPQTFAIVSALLQAHSINPANIATFASNNIENSNIILKLPDKEYTIIMEMSPADDCANYLKSIFDTIANKNVVVFQVIDFNIDMLSHKFGVVYGGVGEFGINTVDITL